MANVTIITENNGDVFQNNWFRGQYSAISEKIFRPFKVFFFFDEEVDSLELSKISTSFIQLQNIYNGLERVMTIDVSNLRGGKRLYSVDIQISHTYNTLSWIAGNLTVSIGENAVAQGNPATSTTFKWCVATKADQYTEIESRTSLTLTDWELLDDNVPYGVSHLFTVQDNLIYTNAPGGIGSGDTGNNLEARNLDGTRNTDKDVANAVPVNGVRGILNNYLFSQFRVYEKGKISSQDDALVYFSNRFTRGSALIHSGLVIYEGDRPWLSLVKDLDITKLHEDPTLNRKSLNVEPLELDDVLEVMTSANSNITTIEHVLIGGNNANAAVISGVSFFDCGLFLGKDLSVIDVFTTPLNTRRIDRRLAMSGTHLFYYALNTAAAGSIRSIYRIEISKLDKPKRRQLIYPIFVDNGGTVDLTKYITGADRITWDVNYEPPSYLSLSGTTLSVAANAVSEETAVEVKLKAFNNRGFTDDNNFKFYIVIEKENTDASRTTPEVPVSEEQVYSDVFRYICEIAGIDVSDDLIGNQPPTVSETMDPVAINEYKVDPGSVTLDWRNGYYSALTSGNFWEQNNLRANGYLEEIKVFVETYVDGTWNKNLLFSGFILETQESINTDTITFNCVDASFKLKNVDISSVGLDKYARSFRNQRLSYQGIYDFEESVLPINPGVDKKVWVGRDKFNIRRVQNASEGVVVGDKNAYVSRTQVLTEGGAVESVPFLKYKTPITYKDSTFVLNEIARQAGLSVRNEIRKPTLNNDFIQNKGNVAFNNQDTRITHIPQDWIHVSGKVYFLLSQPAIGYADMLIEHDIATDEQRILTAFDSDLTCTHLATDDGETFYIAATESIRLDRSLFPVPKDTLEVIGKYDTAQGANTRILRYTRSTDTTTDLVPASETAVSPQVGMHYHVGFANNLRTFDWQGIVPENRDTFKVFNNDLYYRFNRPEGFGLARVSASGTVSELRRVTNRGYKNHLNFAFDIDESNGNRYFAFMTGTVTNSTITIERITSAGVRTQIYTNTRTFNQLTDISRDGGWWTGVYELKFHNNALYLIVGVGHTDTYNDASRTEQKTRSYRLNAGASLYKLDLSDVNAGFKVLDNYAFIQSSIRSLTAHKGQIHYIESPSVSYKFEPFNPDDATTFSLGLNRNITQQVGALKRVSEADEVENLGNLYYTTFPYRSTHLPMLSIDDELHAIMSYGNPENVLRTKIQASRKDNFQWLKYGPKLEYIFSNVPTGNAYDVLTEVAKRTNSTFYMDKDTIVVADRDPYRATGSVSAVGNAIAFSGENKPFPSSGYLLIDDEIVQYTGIASGQFTGGVRGVQGTRIVTHTDAPILFVDKLIDPNSFLDVSMRLDTNRFFNVIRSPNQIIEEREEASIRETFEKVFQLDLGLSRHNAAWIEYLYKKYLEELKALRFVVNLQLKPSRYLRLGDVATFNYDEGILKPFRVSAIAHQRNGTRVQGRTIER